MSGPARSRLPSVGDRFVVDGVAHYIVALLDIDGDEIDDAEFAETVAIESPEGDRSQHLIDDMVFTANDG